MSLIKKPNNKNEKPMNKINIPKITIATISTFSLYRYFLPGFFYPNADPLTVDELTNPNAKENEIPPRPYTEEDYIEFKSKLEYYISKNKAVPTRIVLRKLGRSKDEFELWNGYNDFQILWRLSERQPDIKAEFIIYDYLLSNEGIKQYRVRCAFQNCIERGIY